MKNDNYHISTVKDTLKNLEVDPKRGLSKDEVERRRKRYGENVIGVEKPISPIKIFFSQFADLIIWVLIGALVVSAFLGEYIDAFAILIIVILNAVLGFIQEFRAEKSLLELKKLAEPESTVLRDGKRMTIPAREIVPGDIILLNQGDTIPADARLIEHTNIQTQEANLTGESLPISKKTDPLTDEKLAIGDRVNMLFQSTTVVSGRGQGVVVATGLKTELGKIATLVGKSEKEDTPLTKRLNTLGKILVYGILGICGLVFILGLLHNNPPVIIFLTAVSLAVAAIPEGLPAVVTIALSLGVRRMVEKNALIRKLRSVETLGSTTFICTDKTGTITKNEMTVVDIYTPAERYKPGVNKHEPAHTVKLAMRSAAISNNIYLMGYLQDKLMANIIEDGEVQGDPMEKALIETAVDAGAFIGHEGPVELIHEVPFDSRRKMMSVTFFEKKTDITWVFTKGAPDVVLDKCSYYLDDGEEKILTDNIKAEIINQYDRMASNALRVISSAYKKLGTDEIDRENIEENLIFLGLFGMIDPPREEVFGAVDKCKKAGIIPVVLTGDYQKTAEVISKEVGIFSDGDTSILGRELEDISDEKLKERVKGIKLYSRVSPEHKLRVVKALKELGEVVAMTGDGVNDAPAVTEADIGISMNIRGTDVTREASDMILLDDNFSTIVSAVEEGRRIFDNIRKFIHFLLSCNTGEVLTMLIASFTNMPLPLLPIQILWVNLVTDGLPALALGVDPPEPGLLERPPRSPKSRILGKRELINILWEGSTIAISTLFMFIFVYYFRNEGEVYARTAAFTTLVLSQLFHSLNLRSLTLPLFKVNLFENRYLIVAFLGSFIIHLIIIYTPGLQTIFKTTSLPFTDIVLSFIFSLTPLILVQSIRSINYFIKKKG
jgi:Ca2+-transporting ATPase